MENTKTVAYKVKSNKRSEPNWEGKGFSKLPAKIFFHVEDAIEALCVWYNDYYKKAYNRVVKVISLTDEMKNKLIENKEARL